MFNAAHCSTGLLSAAFICLPEGEKEQYETKSHMIQTEKSLKCSYTGTFVTLRHALSEKEVNTYP